MNKPITHYLHWQRARMACGKQPQEIQDFTSFWDRVTCAGCEAARTPEMTEPGERTPAQFRGHPGATRRLQVDLRQGIFTRVDDHLSIYQDSGHAVRAVVQLANRCGHLRRPDAPGCVLTIDHPGEYHANDLGQAWKVVPE